MLHIVGADWGDVPDDGVAWGINNCIPPVDLAHTVNAWFQMHSEKQWRGGRNGKILPLLRAFGLSGRAVYMQKEHTDIPGSVAYPIGEVSGLWPFKTQPLFSDTFCYMVGLAILHGHKAIDVSSIYLLNDIEAYTEVPGFCMWLTIAAQHGVDVIGSRFLEPFRYGYEPREPSYLLPRHVAAQILVDEDLRMRSKRRKYERGKYLGK